MDARVKPGHDDNLEVLQPSASYDAFSPTAF